MSEHTEYDTWAIPLQVILWTTIVVGVILVLLGITFLIF